MAMPGIVVGVDGSAHSEPALEGAMRKAAIRCAPLTVISVHRASVGYWGSEVSYPPDHDLGTFVARFRE
jgi:nucleotide-binding universal stress UspA family protein